MKNIELNALKQLLEIIGPYPSTAVAHFSDADITLSQTIYNFCHEKSYQYQINATDTSFYTKLNESFQDKPGIRIIDFSLNRPKYLIQGKTYEYLFVTIELPREQRDDFLKKAHEILRNAGNILIFIPNSSDEERYEWEYLLEKNYYVATNTINDLFERYDVIISKKMHGWGDK